jgi:putative nucleotidyltransferase with HDIG domain
MQNLKDSPTHPEVTGHCKRVAELCRRTNKDRITPELLQACRDFDDAVEFAAYEGSALPNAIGGFFEDAAGRFSIPVVDSMRRALLATGRLVFSNQLPVLPSAASKIMRTSADNASVAELETIAASDPVMAARLLGIANSAMFGRGNEIRSLSQAILRLGIPLSRKTLLSSCFGTLFASATLAEIWRHSKTVAALAHELASECGGDPEVAYLAGLVHDIGRLLTQTGPATHQAEVLGLIENGFPLVYAETLIYGADHAALGSELLAVWNLPHEIVEAVTFHHRPESTESALAGILCLAEEESRTDGVPSESLSPGMRRATATGICGLRYAFRDGIDRRSAVFALAV